MKKQDLTCNGLVDHLSGSDFPIGKTGEEPASVGETEDMVINDQDLVVLQQCFTVARPWAEVKVAGNEPSGRRLPAAPIC